jgi:hypothetical protein
MSAPGYMTGRELDWQSAVIPEDEAAVNLVPIANIGLKNDLEPDNPGR